MGNTIRIVNVYVNFAYHVTLDIELEKLILEEQILAEVEKIMEMGTIKFLRCINYMYLNQLLLLIE